MSEIFSRISGLFRGRPEPEEDIGGNNVDTQSLPNDPQESVPPAFESRREPLRLNELGDQERNERFYHRINELVECIFYPLYLMVLGTFYEVEGLGNATAGDYRRNDEAMSAIAVKINTSFKMLFHSRDKKDFKENLVLIKEVQSLSGERLLDREVFDSLNDLRLLILGIENGIIRCNLWRIPFMLSRYIDFDHSWEGNREEVKAAMLSISHVEKTKPVEIPEIFKHHLFYRYAAHDIDKERLEPLKVYNFDTEEFYKYCQILLTRLKDYIQVVAEEALKCNDRVLSPAEAAKLAGKKADIHHDLNEDFQRLVMILRAVNFGVIQCDIERLPRVYQEIINDMSIEEHPLAVIDLSTIEEIDQIIDDIDAAEDRRRQTLDSDIRWLASYLGANTDLVPSIEEVLRSFIFSGKAYDIVEKILKTTYIHYATDEKNINTLLPEIIERISNSSFFQSERDRKHVVRILILMFVQQVSRFNEIAMYECGDDQYFDLVNVKKDMSETDAIVFKDTHHTATPYVILIKIPKGGNSVYVVSILKKTSRKTKDSQVLEL